MVRSKLEQRLCNSNAGLLRRDAKKIIKIILDSIFYALSNNGYGSAEFRSLGRFSVKIQKKRQGRNPRTNEPITIEEKKKVRFRASKLLLKRLNEN